MTTDAIEKSLETTGLNAPRIVIIALCFLIWVVDAFDIVAMSVAAPAISAEWGINHSEMGIVFTAALIGMTIGAIVLAPLADRFGRRKLLLAALFALALSVFSVTLVSSITQLIIVRLITGLAIGSILASATTVASEFAPTKYRAAAVAITALGYSVGATLVGPIANGILENNDWRVIFALGGGLTAIIFMLTFIAMPESIQFLKLNAANDERALEKINKVLSKIKCPPVDTLPAHVTASVKPTGGPMALTRPEHLMRSIMLWICIFAALFITYYALSWTPTLFIEAGYERAEGIRALTLFAFMGIFGILTVTFAFLKFSATRTVAAILLAGGLLMLVFPMLKGSSLTVLYIMFGSIGFLVAAANGGLYSLAAQLYPASIRATGVGWGMGIGRLGAVVAPVLVGYLLTKDWTMYQFFGVFAVPYLLTAWAALYLTAYKTSK